MFRTGILRVCLVTFITFLWLVYAEDATTINPPQAMSLDAELSEDRQMLNADEKIRKSQTEMTEVMAEVSEDHNKLSEDSEERLFDELEEGIDFRREMADPFEDDEDGDPRTFQPKSFTTPGDILKAMRHLERFVGFAAIDNEEIRKVVTPRMKELFRKINVFIEHIVELTLNHGDALKFLEKDGFTRCVLPNMWIEYPELRTNLLRLTKQLFEVTSRTKEVIPIEVLDQLLRVFENDETMYHKTLVIDILYMWLPRYPEAQARVIQLSGLYPFYQQIPKLDTNVVYNMIDLFNTLIKEHMEVKKNKEYYSKEDRKLYQRIGLLKQISTQKSCQGLQTIFQDALEHNTINNNLVVPALELAKLVRPICTKKYKGRKKALDFFIRLQAHVVENRGHLKSYLSDLEDVEAALEKYVEDLKPNHIEL